MNSSLRVERIFSLSDYNNIKFSQEILDIPKEALLNPKVVGLLYKLMMTEIEKAHKEYVKLYKEYPATLEQIDKTLEIIEEHRSSAFKELLEELSFELENK